MGQTIVRHEGGMRFVGQGKSGHAVPMDAVSDVGGRDSAARPIEILLCALGGCTGMDVISILHKMRTEPASLRDRDRGRARDGLPQGDQDHPPDLPSEGVCPRGEPQEGDRSLAIEVLLGRELLGQRAEDHVGVRDRRRSVIDSLLDDSLDVDVVAEEADREVERFAAVDPRPSEEAVALLGRGEGVLAYDDDGDFLLLSLFDHGPIRAQVARQDQAADVRGFEGRELDLRLIALL